MPERTRPAAPPEATPPPPVPARAGWAPMPALTHVLLLAGIVSGVFIIVTFAGFGGWSYYRTPLRTRGFDPAHRLLRPAGGGGQIFAVAGTILLLATLLYVIRKKSRRLAKIGSQKNWLEAHIFCGIVGPVLITLHTSFKFNGVISVAYWCMVLVVLSGFIGRYLYVRVPKTLRGTELTYGELAARTAELTAELAAEGLPRAVAAKIEAFERHAAPGAESPGRAFLLGDLRLRRSLSELRREIRRSGLEERKIAEVYALIRDRAVLRRRIAYLGPTKKLFSLWHVFHKPLVYVMFAIAAIHVALAIYLGYGMVRW